MGGWMDRWMISVINWIGMDGFVDWTGGIDG